MEVFYNGNLHIAFIIWTFIETFIDGQIWKVRLRNNDIHPLLTAMENQKSAASTRARNAP